MTHIAEYLLKAAVSRPHATFFRAYGHITTAEQAWSRTARLAGLLIHHGLQPGQPVALLAQNGPHFLEALLAVVAAGGIAAPLNWRWSAAEACTALGTLRPIALLADAPCAAAFDLCQLSSSIAGSCCLLIGSGHTGACGWQLAEDQLGRLGQGILEPVASPDGTAIICFTSGTTGGAKGVCLSHVALHFQALTKVDVVGYSASDVYLHIAPLCHIGGLVSALAMLLVGATHIFPSASRPSPADTVRLIKELRVTTLIAVPAMIADLAAQDPPQAMPSVQRLLLGGGALPARLHSTVATLFPCTAVMTAYGMTEGASSITYHPLLPVVQPRAGIPPGADCVGRPPHGIEIAIWDLESAALAASGCPIGAECTNVDESGSGTASPSQETGIVGEVLTRGPHMMSGYWHDAAATRVAFVLEGWFRTGDLGCIDANGHLWLAGRLKDVVRSGGENIHASEVEKVLLRHPAIVSAAVVGVPHPRLGEQVAALLVLKDDVEWTTVALHDSAAKSVLSSESVRQHCRQQGLTSFRLPRFVFGQHAALLVNSSGKVLKHQVREQLLALMRADKPDAAEIFSKL